MTQAILAALKALDVKDDTNWTADGQPRLDTVRMLASDPVITREMINEVAPGFTRDNAIDYVVPAPGVEQGAPPPPAGTAADIATAPPPTGPQPSSAPSAPPVQSEPQAGPEQNNPLPSANAAPPAPEAEQAKVGTGAGSAENAEPSLDEQIKEAAKEVERLGAIRNQAVKDHDVAMRKHDALIDLQNKHGVESNTQSIQNYLASQQRKLEERAARSAILKDSGINLKQLARDLKSPLDSAMGRRNTRGTTRPKL